MKYKKKDTIHPAATATGRAVGLRGAAARTDTTPAPAATATGRAAGVGEALTRRASY